jgi:hypothetical protein
VRVLPYAIAWDFHIVFLGAWSYLISDEAPRFFCLPARQGLMANHTAKAIMKPLLFLLGIFLCLNCYSQSRQVSLIGKQESDVLFEMKSDTTFTYDKQTFEPNGNYHITYESRNKSGLCNFYFENNICTIVVFYMTIEKLPDIITDLNHYYKRTDNVTWVEKTLHYKVVFHTENKGSFQLAYTKL